jgi:urease accessory protein
LTGDRLLPGDLAVLAPHITQRQAKLRLECDADGGTFLSSQSAPYPFHICRPFYLAGDAPGMATVYLQSCAGGIFESDRLEIELQAEQGAQAHVTTSASTIVHGMPVGYATQRVTLNAAANSTLEFLPDPLILFPNARLASRVRVRLAEDATVLLADAFVLHDPAAQDQSFDWLHNEITIEDDAGKMLVVDRVHASGAIIAERCLGVTGEYAAQGSFYALGRRGVTGHVLEGLRSALDGIPDIYGGASTLPNNAGAFVRLLARDASCLRTALLQSWRQCRMILTGRAPVPRKK